MKYHDPKTILSPRSFIESIRVIYDGGEESFSLAMINWEGNHCIGIRWNISRREYDDPEKLSENKICSGMPVAYGHPVWFILPNDLFEIDSEGHTALKVSRDRLTEISRTTRKRIQQGDDRNVLHLMIGPGIGNESGRHSALKEIRDFTKGATELIIIDPYIFGGESHSAKNYIEDFKRSSRINASYLKKISIVFNSKMGNTAAIKNGIKQLAQQNHCKIIMHDTDKIHDRIWIKNTTEAIVIGTSFGGIGGKLCFLLPLPNDDLHQLLEFLDSQKMLVANYH